MKPKANRVLVPSLLLVAFVVVGLNTWLAFRAVNSLVRSHYWVDHTWQSIDQVERIMSSAKDAEIGNCGYLLTGDENYLAPYLSATHDLPAELDRFQSLTADNPSQQQRLQKMRAAINARMLLLQQGIDLRRSRSLDTRHTMSLTGTGKPEMDHLRGIADEMEAEEHRLLVVRNIAADSARRESRYTLALAGCLDFFLIVMLLRYFIHERHMRFVSEQAAERLAVARAETEERAEEIRTLNATLESRVKLRTAELETINRELEAFSYSVSHDLRAPLRTIDGFSLALEEDYTTLIDDAGKDYIRRVRNGVQRMGQLIDSLLQLSRITRAEVAREDIDISHLAESIAADLKEQSPSANLAFHIEPGLKANADPRLLRVALENLLGNAVKFSSKVSNPTIEFGWDREQKAWFVRDNGAGFDMFYADRLFNAFNRLHGDKDFTGSGIGLATVARVIHRHQGRIWASGVVHHGATFWFTLG